MFALTLLAALFAPWVDATGSPSFRVRERGSAVLGQFWPLSAPAIEAGLSSPDPEVRRRCHAAARDGRTRNLYGGQTEGRFLAHVLVFDPHEKDGIPWANRQWAVAWGGREDVRRGLVELANELKLRGPDGDVFAFECPYFFYDPYPYGLDDLRCRARGIPSAFRPYDDRTWDLIRDEWAAIKGR